MNHVFVKERGNADNFSATGKWSNFVDLLKPAAMKGLLVQGLRR
jgi:hypothetical protein